MAANKHVDENKSFKDKSSFGNAEHAKSMGMGDASADSLLLEDDTPVRNLKEKAAGHSSFHKRPLSHNNGVRSKSSRQKRRKKTPVAGNKPQNTLISNTANTNSRVTQDVTDNTDEGRSKKLIDDSKLGKNKSVVNASNRPKSSRGNRSFDNNSTSKVMGKTDIGFKQKRNSIAANPSKHHSNNFGKKKNSYGGAGANHFNANKLLAKYRGGRNPDGASSSFSMHQHDQPKTGLVASIKEKNSRNIEKFTEKGIMGSNSIVELPENSSQYLINSENLKGDKMQQNMSFDVNHKRGLIKQKKKHKDEANKALLNFEDMKRKILKDYVKKNGKDVHSNSISNPSHHRNAGMISNYLTQLDDYDRAKEASHNSRTYSNKEKELMQVSEDINRKKKHVKKAVKDKFSSIYDPNLSNGAHW